MRLLCPEVNVRVCQMISVVSCTCQSCPARASRASRALEWVNSLLVHVDGVCSRNQRLLKVTVSYWFLPLEEPLSVWTLEHSRLCSHKLVMLNAEWQITQGWVCDCFFDYGIFAWCIIISLHDALLLDTGTNKQVKVGVRLKRCFWFLNGCSGSKMHEKIWNKLHGEHV